MGLLLGYDEGEGLGNDADVDGGGEVEFSVEADAEVVATLDDDVAGLTVDDVAAEAGVVEVGAVLVGAHQGEEAQTADGMHEAHLQQTVAVAAAGSAVVAAADADAVGNGAEQ